MRYRHVACCEVGPCMGRTVGEGRGELPLVHKVENPGTSRVHGSAQRGAGARHSGHVRRRATHGRMHSRWKVCEQGSARATCEGWIVSKQIEQVVPSPPCKPPC